MAKAVVIDKQAVKLARAERLKRARKEIAGYSSARVAAKRFGWKEDAVKAHEAGRNGFDDAQGAEYARAYRVSRQWLCLNIGEPFDSDFPDDAEVINVLARVPAGRLQATDAVTPTDIEKTIVVSGLGRGDWAALIVDGSSMDKIAPNGSIIVYNRADTQPVNNGFFVFRHPDTGEATFKRYGEGMPPRLRPYSNEDFDPIIANDLVILGRVRKVLIDL